MMGRLIFTVRCSVLAVVSSWWCLADFARADLRSDFAEPPLEHKTRPLWFWNGPLSKRGIQQQMENCRDKCGYYGFGILPSQRMTPAYTSPEFLDRYEDALNKAAALGMKMCLYDEFWFPSGNAGGQLAAKYPGDTAKRLDVLEEDVSGPLAYKKAVPPGTLIGAVAMKGDTQERIDVTGRVRRGLLAWNVPPGTWKIMIFVCVRDGWDHVDYLSPQSVKRFIELTYQRFYDRFPKHFGTTIDSAFYDEPTFWQVRGGRMWTADFNQKFEAKYGRSPVPYYPALWHDVGPETEAARVALFGFRAELFATGFVKTINDWCRDHKIRLTGHVDQEEVVNPTGLCGDLIKAFKHQDVPGIDQIFRYGRASKAYKLISSAAYNYDRPLVMTETYGAIGNLSPAALYKEAMDQYAKGINLMVPHAVWYNPAAVVFPPELSYRSPIYGPVLPQYNKYMGRLNLLLQSGRHVADVAVLYPIATLQAGYRFGVGKPYEGGIIPAEADYMDVGEMLSLGVRRDFTFLHPEVLDEKCTVRADVLTLDNARHPQAYRVVVLPGSKTIAWSNLDKIQTFYENGGKVIATTRLPYKSAEFGKEDKVRAAVMAIFGIDPLADAYPRVRASSSWVSGGHEPPLAADGNPETRWNAADGTSEKQWLEVDFGENKTFNRTLAREAFERITSYKIQAWNGTHWVTCATGTKCGPEKTDRFAPVTASKVRLHVDSICSDSVSVREFAVFDRRGRNLAVRAGANKANSRGGKAYFVACPTEDNLRRALDDAMRVYDVEIEPMPSLTGGNFSYIHKIRDGRDVYFFANSSDAPIDVYVRLRGKLTLETWDPHTGKTARTEYSHETEAGREITRARLALGPVRSLFLVGASR